MDLRGKLPNNGQYDKRPIESIVGITIHYTASPIASGIGAVEHIAREQLKRVADPKTGEKFPAIAYTIVVDGDGVGYLCHDLDVRCWHSGARVDGVSRNVSHEGICFIGNGEPSEVQVAGLVNALLWSKGAVALAVAGERLLAVEGHGDVYSTTCPGPNWQQWRGRLPSALP